MEQLNHYLETRDLAVNTIKTYRNSFLTILNILNLPTTVPNIDWIRDPKTITSIMDTDRALTIKTNLIGLLSGLAGNTFGQNSHVHMEYKNQLTRMVMEVNDLKMDQEKSVNQIENWIPYPKLVELITGYQFDKLVDGKLKKSLLTFLAFLPRRLGELAIMKFIYKPHTKLNIEDLSNEFNYLVLDDDVKKCKLLKLKSFKLYAEEFTVFIKVKTANLKEFSNSILLKLSSEVKTNREMINIIIVKKYLFISLKSKFIFEKKSLFIKTFFGLLKDRI